MDLSTSAWGTGPRNGLQPLPNDKLLDDIPNQQLFRNQDPSLSLIIPPKLKSQLLTLAPLTNHDLSCYSPPLGLLRSNYTCPLERRAQKLGRERCGFQRRLLGDPQTWGEK